MHNAPAVSFPVGRSFFHAGLLVSVSMAGALTLLVWMVSSDALQTRHAGVALLWLAGTAWSALAWWRTPVGSLAWDGQVWTWTCRELPLTVEVAMTLDTQSSLLLCLRSGPARAWVWPERRMLATRWLALRRAVFAAPATSPGLDPVSGSL